MSRVLRRASGIANACASPTPCSAEPCRLRCSVGVLCCGGIVCTAGCCELVLCYPTSFHSPFSFPACLPAAPLALLQRWSSRARPSAALHSRQSAGRLALAPDRHWMRQPPPPTAQPRAPTAPQPRLTRQLRWHHRVVSSVAAQSLGSLWALQPSVRSWQLQSPSLRCVRRLRQARALAARPPEKTQVPYMEARVSQR